MPGLTKEETEQVRSLDSKSLHDIVMKLMSKDKFAYDFVITNYLDKQQGENDLFEQVKEDLDILTMRSYRGFSEQLQMANMLGACIKRINEFTKVSKNKVMEADLLVHVLKGPFGMPTDMFGTCFTQYDTKVAMLVKRLVTLVTKKLHEDYLMDYRDEINRYLDILHQHASHIDTVYKMPKAI